MIIKKIRFFLIILIFLDPKAEITQPASAQKTQDNRKFVYLLKIDLFQNLLFDLWKTLAKQWHFQKMYNKNDNYKLHWSSVTCPHPRVEICYETIPICTSAWPIFKL